MLEDREHEDKALKLCRDYINDPERLMVYKGVVIKRAKEYLSKNNPEMYEIDKLVKKGTFLSFHDFDLLVIAVLQLMGRVDRNKSIKDDTFWRMMRDD